MNKAWNPLCEQNSAKYRSIRKYVSDPIHFYVSSRINNDLVTAIFDPVQDQLIEEVYGKA